MKRNISVIIPTYNSWLTLKSCVTSIYRQTLKPFEIIIVDNGSTDGTSDHVKKIFSEVKLVTLMKNTGVTGGRNTGIKTASRMANYIFFFDHDMVATPKMLEELMKIAENNKDIGIVTPKIYYWENKKRIWSAGTGVNLWTGQVIFRGGSDKGQYEKAEEVQVAPAAMLVKKEAILTIGDFDNRYFATFEDTDFCFRARKNKFRTFYAPKAIAYHKISVDPKEEATRLLNRAYWVGKNRILFMRDFGKSFLIFLLFLPIYLLYYIMLAIKNSRLLSIFEFLRGTLEGIISK